MNQLKKNMDEFGALRAEFYSTLISDGDIKKWKH